VLASLIAIVLLFGAPQTPVWADITEPGGTLEQQISDLAGKIEDAQAKLDAAQAKQVKLTSDLATTEVTLERLQAQAGQIAARLYRFGAASNINVLLNATSPDDLLDRLTSVHMFAEEQSIVLADLKHIEQQDLAQRDQIAQEVELARQQTANLQAQQNKLRAILVHATGGPTGVVIAAPTAAQSPRNPDGSWPAESCNQTDPTSGGCLTPRTLHMYNEVKKAGFDHYVHCWRTQSWGEHPKGRACDWAAAKDTFGGVATGSDYAYGAKLAGWFIGNSDRLGVMYVIWFKQIWIPGQGWHRYTTEGGNPSGDHTNHVHVSIR
jgi:hypothetical protein